LVDANSAIFMSRMLHYFLKQFQCLPLAPGGSMQHECDTERLNGGCVYHLLDERAAGSWRTGQKSIGVAHNDA
jgi:hypothetical protein